MSIGSRAIRSSRIQIGCGSESIVIFGLGGCRSAGSRITVRGIVARFIEGAGHYKLPVPQFELEHVNEADANVTYWNITMFSDVRAMMSCWHGWVQAFVADANNSDGMSRLHLSTLMGIGLYSNVLEWREAIALRDQLMREATNTDFPQIVERTIDGTKVSLIISVAGVPSFQIDNPH